jgi:4-amino-4-deoxy-L-arabinose transferase-like glycosyltransferase
MPTRRAARKLAKMAVAPVHPAPPPGEPSIWRALARAVAAEDRLYLWALTTLIVLAAAIRLYDIDRPMNYDETYTYLTYASRPLAEALSNYSQPNNHLWHTALVHLSTALFGNAPWAIRLPAFLAGVVLAPATYLAARMLAVGRGALIAAALVAENRKSSLGR